MEQVGHGLDTTIFVVIKCKIEKLKLKVSVISGSSYVTFINYHFYCHKSINWNVLSSTITFETFYLS
jgi:hypothetical protein